MKQKQYCEELTVMSGFAILLVLGIHGCAAALGRFYPEAAGFVQTGYWLRVISSLVTPAVPIFLFVSGYKFALHDMDTPYYSYLRKRLPRVVMSFAIINTVFWALDSVIYVDFFDPILLLKTYLHSWVGYSVAYQLWYIPMYCFVLCLCPLVCRAIPMAGLRFLLYAAIGVGQRILEVRFPVLAAYPIRFISYPVFFEMGLLAHKTNWKKRITPAAGAAAVGAYILGILLLSWVRPEWATDGLTKYVVYYFGGTAVFYAVSAALQGNRFLQWAGAVSYPVFLLHEPLIGRLVGKLLWHLPLGEVSFALCWTVLVLAAAWLVMQLFRKLKIDQVLWNFHISEKKGSL